MNTLFARPRTTVTWPTRAGTMARRPLPMATPSLVDRPAPHVLELVSRRAGVPMSVPPMRVVVPPTVQLRVQQALVVGHGKILNLEDAERQPTRYLELPVMATLRPTVGDIKELLQLGPRRVLRRDVDGWTVLRDTDEIDLTDPTVEYRAAKTAWSS